MVFPSHRLDPGRTMYYTYYVHTHKTPRKVVCTAAKIEQSKWALSAVAHAHD